MSKFLDLAYQHYLITTTIIAASGFFCLAEGTSHSVGLGWDYKPLTSASWSFNPFLIALGGGLLVGAFLFYKDAKGKQSGSN